MANRKELDQARLEAAAKRLRDSGSLGRSASLLRLFDFLVDRSLSDKAPKEIEIAQEVFAQGADFDMMQDASVRVHIHRLRRKLEDFKKDHSELEDVLILPRGEYRLALASVEERAPQPDRSLDGSVADARETRTFNWRHPRLIAVLVLAVALNVATWWLISARRSDTAPAQAARAPLWAGMRGSARPLYIVTGDLYVFGELGKDARIVRTIRDPAINSTADLDRYLIQHPADATRYVDITLSYLPVGVASAMRNLLPVLSMLTDQRSPRVISASQFSGEMLRTSDTVYIGQLSGLGLLSHPLFTYGGFQLGATPDELIDRASGRHYRSDWSIVAKGGKPQRDFGYIASLTGPSGSRLIVVAGTHDAAVVQMSRIVTDRARMDQLSARTHDRARFEALYEVQTAGNYDLASRLILARPLPEGPSGAPTPQN